MDNVQRDRLTRFANYLLNKPTKHTKFDFGTIAYEDKCGTVGCAMGELPYYNPKRFKFVNSAIDHDRLIVKDKETGQSNRLIIEDYFGLDWYETSALFYPGMTGYVTKAKLKATSGDTTRKTVARNILKFLKWKQKVKSV